MCLCCGAVRRMTDAVKLRRINEEGQIAELLDYLLNCLSLITYYPYYLLLISTDVLMSVYSRICDDICYDCV